MDAAASAPRDAGSPCTWRAPAPDSSCSRSVSSQGRRPGGCWSRPRSERPPLHSASAPPAAAAGLLFPLPSGAVPPPRQPRSLEPDRAPQCRDRVAAAAQSPSMRDRPSRSPTLSILQQLGHPASAGELLILQPPSTAVTLALSASSHPPPWLGFLYCRDPPSSLQRTPASHNHRTPPTPSLPRSQPLSFIKCSFITAETSPSLQLHVQLL